MPKIDFEKINKSKNYIGAIVEVIVFDYLREFDQKEDLDTPIHASKEEGDGLGYDIRYWDKNGKEIHVEVKTTTSNYVDGFEITWNEVEASLNTYYSYGGYRVYDFKLKIKDVKLRFIRNLLMMRIIQLKLQK